MNLQELELELPYIKNNLIIKGKKSSYLDVNKQLLNYLNSKYNNCFRNIQELIFILNNECNLQNLHVFCKCGNKNKFLSSVAGYSNYCSYKCSNGSIDRLNKRKQQMLEKYGVEYYYQTEEFKRKRKNSFIKKFGTDNPQSLDEIKNKTIQTSLKKYGVTNYAKTDESKLKNKQTCIKKYGVDSYTKTEECQNKMKSSCLKKYGVSYFLQSNYCKKKKIKTCNKKYRKDYYNQTDEFRKKRYNSLKLHNTFNTSKPEKEIYKFLLLKFPDTIHYYDKDSRYPFECDFYIPSKDLFIEYNGTWMHNKEPFDKNNIKRIKQVENWNQKSFELNSQGKQKLQYKQAIYIWTKSDPLKVRTARENKLNYLVFYNMEQFNNWYKNI